MKIEKRDQNEMSIDSEKDFVFVEIFQNKKDKV